MPGRCSMVFDDAATTNTTVNSKKYKIPVRMAGREILDKLFDRCYACKITKSIWTISQVWTWADWNYAFLILNIEVYHDEDLLFLACATQKMVNTVRWKMAAED